MILESMNEKSLDKRIDCIDCEALTDEDDCNTTVCGRCARADGCNTKANGDCSHAEGCGTKANGDCSHAEGSNTSASENNSHSEGCNTKAFGNCSHSEGSNTAAYTDSSHAEGYNTKTRGNYAHSEGYSTEANGESSHAQGAGSKAEGYASSCKGGSTTARGSYSEAGGISTVAEAYASHAEGAYTTARGSYSHAEGYSTTATGSYSHTEGYSTLSEGYAAHAEGYSTAARAPYSHSEGYNTDTKLNSGANIMGIYGDADTPYSWFLAGGAYNERALAAKILYTGDAYIRNSWNAGGIGYAEMYNTLCGQTIEPGYFVTLEGECIRTANRNDYVVGITTVSPGFAANNNELSPGNNFQAGSWNEPLYEEFVIPKKADNEGNEIVPEQVVKQPKTQSEGLSRTTAASSLCGGTFVTLLGQVLVRDDGTCVANEYCIPNENGIATASSFGYIVMRRVSDNQVLVFFR